ncbi:MAG: site-specific DNA-methyltransferase [Ruminococcaceae bacterium]|nr:site-specific DNA-methyltransferase [Oscillospiraceae bacterium]
MANFFDTVIEVLKQDERFFSEEGELLRNTVYESAMKMDSDLLKLLYNNEMTRERFFTDVDGISVFDKVGFGWVINNRQFLPDSYTRYKNKIGLTNGNGDYISTSNDVELVFPYKDCVLAGGQTKEDQNRSEIFYNETLAPDEVDRLLYPKVFTNAKRYTTNGKEEIVEFNENDNLIIKGNNLLVLASLLKRFEGKIKCVYIDPPFNTQKDDFKYNDNFNHSTWLSFMRNRLMIAKKLLAPDGSIFVHLDFHESHYAKILMDEIFGRECFRNNIVWCYTGPSGSNNFLPRKHDDILYYSKTENNKYHIQYIEHKSGVHNSGQVFGSTDVIDNFKAEAEQKGKKLEDFWLDIYSTDRYRSEMLGFAGQKPEKLIQRILNISTDENDIVLDFHLGSGTTAAVAHKMKRKYICVEQMESQIELSIDRLINVIDGEQTGISKDVDWQGGGSFVYCELAKLNQKYVDGIQTATNDSEIVSIWEEMLKTGFISCKVKPSEIDMEDTDFLELSLDDKKRFLMEMLDKNQLYVNYCDIEDETFAVSEADKAFTKSFYGGM